MAPSPTTPEIPARHRLAMPRAERRTPWLRHLFDLYALVDASVAEALKASGRQCGCGSGCDACCRQNIPVTPLEAAGLAWYVREEMPEPLRAALRERRENAGPDCPDCGFLLNGSCAAYTFRPVASRRYMVLGAPCPLGEDATATRPGDVLRPSREALNAAYAQTLPYYAAMGQPMPDQEKAFAFMVERTVPLATVLRTIFSATSF